MICILLYVMKYIYDEVIFLLVLTDFDSQQESVEDVRVNFNDRSGGCVSPPPRHTETPLLPPGRILYCFPSLPIEDRLVSA